MNPYTDRKESGDSTLAVRKESQRTRMKKPQIHTTRYGTQSVDVVEVIRSEAGWSEIQRIKEANLVHPSSSENGTNASPSNDNDNKVS
jgi:hypothetical protein